MAKIAAAKKAQLKAKKGNFAKLSKAYQSKTDKTATAKLRKSITPGTVLILLAGSQKGKRVVFLKQLDNGLLLVTGPFKVNGVPVRRVDQAYVIATSTKVELPAAATAAVASIDNSFFKASKKAIKASTQFFEGEAAPAKVEISAERVALQKAVDEALLPAVKAVGVEFVAYLGSKFALTQAPHTLKF